MVSFPIPSQVPGADRATVDIAAALKAMPDPCGFAAKSVFIVAIAKPTNTSLPLYLPVSGATVEGRVSSMGLTVKSLSAFADLKGITYSCISIMPWWVGITYEFRVKQYNVDFGNGFGQYSKWKFATDIVVFEGKIDIPCVSGTFPINADFLNLIPRVWSDPISINVPGYKTITPTGMPFTIYVNNVEIGSGTFTGAPLSFTSTKKLTDIPALLAAMGKSVEVKAVIKFGVCEWVGRKTITLPAPPEVPCLGSMIFNLPNWQDISSKPSLPGTIPIPFTITAGSGATLPPTIPLVISIDGRKVADWESYKGENSMDILKIIKDGLGVSALSSKHTVDIKVNNDKLRDCKIPAESFEIPSLLPPCSGIINIGDFEDLTQIISKPSLPGSIPVPVTVTGKSLPASMTLSILVDGTERTTRTVVKDGSINIDILSIIRSLPLGTAALKDSHKIDIKSKLPDCDILPAFINVPALVKEIIEFLKGIIKIPSIPKPPKIPYPINISIDGILEGGPPISKEVDPGTHNITVELKGMANIYRKVYVESGETVTITDIAFIEEVVIEVCQIGQERKIGCPDGTEIVIEKCEKDPTTGINRWVPTGNTCPPPEMGKIIKILTYPAGAALEAFDGMDVTITASVVCGASPSSGETAIFLVDGKEISRGTTSGGFVSFPWTATVEPSRTHKICVSIPKSSQCSQYGEARDCKTITVSRAVPDVLERLKKERESYLAQLEAQRIEREKIREISLTLPLQPYVPVVTIPTIPEVPIISIPVLPPAEQVPGIIDIPAVTAPPGVPYSIEIRIDGTIIGPPPVYKEVTPGTHTITISLKGFTPISKKVNLTAGQILTIQEGFI
jgi:hypothetical protein